MKSFDIGIVGGLCSLGVFIAVLIVINSFDVVIGGQDERNYNRFVQNVDGLTNTFRQQVEECAQKAVEIRNNDCIKSVDEEYRTQFGSLIKLFGYESHIQEIYQYWQADLEFWYEAKKIQLEYSQNPEVIELEIKRLSDIRDKAVQARLLAEFASQVESSR